MHSRTLRYGVLWLSALAAIRPGAEAQPQIEIPLIFDDGGRYVALAGVVSTFLRVLVTELIVHYQSHGPSRQLLNLTITTSTGSVMVL